jgi:hypothetical protein
MKHIIKQLLREHLLMEIEIYPSKETGKSEYAIQYEFTADNIPYVVILRTDEQKEIYELGFNVKETEDSAYRTKKDLKHLNNVLATVDNIVKDAVEKYRIKKIQFSGAREQSDSNVPFIDPLRLKAYLRYLKMNHPNVIIDKDRFGNATLNMNSIYPHVFEQNKDDKEKLIDLLHIISNENKDDWWRFDKNFNPNQYDKNIEGETDSIESPELGPARLKIDYYDGEYEVEIELYDSDEIFQKTLYSFDDTLNFIKQTFLK